MPHLKSGEKLLGQKRRLKMKQESFRNMEYRCRKKKTKRGDFLEIILLDEWVSLIVPHYPSGKRGCPPIGIETMLRMYLLQCWFSLSDEGVEATAVRALVFFVPPASFLLWLGRT